MLFPTIEFAVFFAAIFPVAWALNERNTAKKLLLVAASYLFYSFWDWRFVLLLFGSSAGNFLIGLVLARLDTEPRLRRAVLIAGVGANLLLLCYFKYYNFFAIEVVNSLATLGLRLDVSLVEVTLPVAISFLTFHGISYVVDVYRRTIPATRSLLDVLLYVSFFPHLVAGPIVRASEFLPQAELRSDPDEIELGRSAMLILGGLFKKVVIANYIGTNFVDGVFADPASQTSLDLVLASYAYAIQIYCDFSAYTDIAIGVASLLGYKFPQNFDQPYRATSLREFWRRWHITLSRWLRDYLYIPLGGNRRGQPRALANLMITMVLGGLWHGANVTFMIWGAIHGAALVLEHLVAGRGRDGSASLSRPTSPVRAVLGWLVTLHVVCAAWIFFRSPSLEAAFTYFARMAQSGEWTTTMSPFVAALVLIGAATQFVPPDMQRRLGRGFDAAPMPAKIALCTAAIYAIAVFAPAGVPPFIYFQF
ncbi:MBOAT family protein [Enterovirga sp.]|uniref:MBOAT family O-acyltransferase n=1 Tax=Enterovirga sp. TaxID=2026350 RepID=UPI00260B6231|nr:MBOAT family protein [Enterovirga sp.]MDB5589848.1 acyltransferase [Enterovirga sp.]